MESILRELDIAREPYCAAELVWNFSSSAGLCVTNTTKAKKVDIRKRPYDL